MKTACYGMLIGDVECWSGQAFKYSLIQLGTQSDAQRRNSLYLVSVPEFPSICSRRLEPARFAVPSSAGAIISASKPTNPTKETQ